ncbi:cupin domain-containing protein [Sinorhizobium americanum]|uniref:cupin domain-containing protein n=1 Tax=Sinorhizobium americanum TaxID=194963 RepID=UPI001FD8DE24|nr:cupin domain-containing protein [Sinorhizobium americanum]
MIIRRDPAGGVDASVIEEIVPPDVAAPLHRHSWEDEISYVIEGTFRIWRGDDVVRHRPWRHRTVTPPSGPLLQEHWYRPRPSLDRHPTCRL